MHIQTDRALIPAATPSVRYLQILISAPSAPAPAEAPRPAAQVALVLDRSGSMDGSKIAMARKAVTHAIRLLKPQDHMAVVCYDDQVDTVLACTPASKEAKGLAFSRLAAIDARGSTNLSGGWLAGAHELRPDASDEVTAIITTTATAEPAGGSSAAGVKRVLLLTDGLANAGEVDPQVLAATAARLRREGITTSTFGIGADFDEELLSQVATQGGGHFYYIEKAGQIPDFFVSELGEALNVVARDAALEIMCPPGVTAELLNDLPTEPVSIVAADPLAAGRSGLRVRLGDLVADQELTLTIAVRVPEPPPLGTRVEVACCLVDQDAALFPQPLAVDWAVVPAAENDAQPVNHAVVLAVAAALAARAQAQALAKNRRGAYDEARQILKEAARVVRVLGGGSVEVEAIIARLQHDEQDFAGAMSPAVLKQRHFVAYSISASRDPEGKARRKARPTTE